MVKSNYGLTDSLDALLDTAENESVSVQDGKNLRSFAKSLRQKAGLSGSESRKAEDIPRFDDLSPA